MPEREVTKEEVRAFINDVWKQIEPLMIGMRIVEVEGRTLFQFTVNSGIGSIESRYEPDLEKVSDLLNLHDYNAAFHWLKYLLAALPLSVSISAKNAIEAATVKTIETSGDFYLVETKGQQGSYPVDVKGRRKKALQNMARHNETLVGTDTRGPEKKITPRRINIVIEKLKAEGASPEEITHDAIGLHLGCGGKAVSNYFARAGGSLKEMVGRSFRQHQADDSIDESAGIN
jgi:hypothetical protein